MACFIFFQSWFEAHPLCGLTLPAVLFPLESRESWGLCGCPLPTLPSCWCLSWCLHPAGKSSVGLVSQGPRASGCGVSPGEAGKCWGSSRVVLCFHQFCTTSNPLPHPWPHNLSEFRCPGRAHPLPLLCPAPALPTNFLHLRSSRSPWGPCCWGHPGHGWRSGYAGASLSTPCVASFLQATSWEAALKRATFSVCPGELGLLAVHSSKRVGSLRANLYLFADLTEVHPQLPA